MNNFTKVALPIILVIAIVSGITFITQYSDAPDETLKDMGGKSNKQIKAPPLKFYSKEVKGAPLQPSNKIPITLQLWNPEVEVNEPGHHEFWVENSNEEPVTIKCVGVNCQCAGVDLAVLSPEMLDDYRITSLMLNPPGLIGGVFTAAAFNHIQFSSKVKWEKMYSSGFNPELSIPAMNKSKGAPQRAMIRLNWSGKDPVGDKQISAALQYSLPDRDIKQEQLVANILVVPSFDLYRREGDKWTGAREIPVGELQENSVVKYTFYAVSATRRQMALNTNIATPNEGNDPCITISDPVEASPDEIESFNNFIVSASGSEKPIATRVKSMYKFQVTVRERVKWVEDGKTLTKQLDLGVLERKLTVSAIQGGQQSGVIRGRVFGEINLVRGAETGRIELGNAFKADQDHSKEVILISERVGLEAKLLDKETTPAYLITKFEAIAPLSDGRKQWKLKVTVPKGTLFGSLPDSSAVILQTNDPIPRKIRIPVRGQSVHVGGPVF